MGCNKETGKCQDYWKQMGFSNKKKPEWGSNEI